MKFNQFLGDETKDQYKITSDKIWEKRYNSPHLIRRYIHRAQYNSIINNIEKFSEKPNLILDYGCGEGVLSVLMAKQGFNVVGMDISIPNIKMAKFMAKEKNLTIDFVNGDGENLPFEDKSFDLVVASHVVEHLPNLERGLDEIKRVSDKAIIAVPTCTSLSSLTILGGDSPWIISPRTPYGLFYGFMKLIKNLNQLGVPEKYGGKDEFPHPWYFPWKFKDILKNNGFIIKKIEAGSLIFPYVSYIVPQTIGFFRFLDRYRDKKVLCYLGYGTNYYIEVKK